MFRGSSTLITGVPGTSKTTLAGKFAEAACRRGERTLFVSFDEGAEPIAAQSASVGIQLKPHVKSGLLRMYSARTESIGAEDHLAQLKALIREHRPRCMVIDPLSAIAKAGGIAAARAVANRLIYMVKDEGITVMVTAINEGDEPADRSDRPADLDDRGYLDPSLVPDPQRRTQPRAHHHQVARHLALEPGARADPERRRPDAGRRLYRRRRGADGHAALGKGGRGAQRRRCSGAPSSITSAASCRRAEADTRARIKALQQDLERQRAELTLYSSDNEARIVSSSEREKELRRIRSADPAKRGNGGNGGNGR